MVKNKRNSAVIDGINIQDYYEGLKLKRDSITAEVEILEKSFKVCTHKKTTKHVVKKDFIEICDGCDMLISSDVASVQFGE